MADTMQFDLVSPERRLASGAATSVLIPGTDGDLTAMPDHAPVITTLRPGILTVELESGTEEYAVTGGFAEVSGTGATVLAEVALVKAEMTAEILSEQLAAATKARDEASTETIDAATKRVADLEALGSALGLSA